MKRIGINEVHEVLMQIMDQIHKIALKHNIPYYLAGGAMLGAIRHQAIIPWDDDIDLCVPSDRFDVFVDILADELKYPYRVLTYKNCTNIVNGFAKIDDQTTIIDDIRQKGKLEDKFGVNIDLFPVYECSPDMNWSKMERWKKMIELKYVPSASKNCLKRFIHNNLRFFIPHDKFYYIKKVQDFSNQQHGDYMAAVWGRYGAKKEIISKKIWGKPTLCNLGGKMYYGVEKPHEYLLHLYGPNYMELPPVEKRFTHVENIYRR